MKVSVIIPLYNLEEYIEKSIESVLAQRFDGDLEIIVVDDGSRDGGYKIVEQMCKTHSNIRLIHQENAGVSAARNTGLDAAQGKYIVFVDGDDILFPDALKTLVDTMENNKDAILACGEHQRITSYDQQPQQPEPCIKCSDTNEILSLLLTERYSVSACAGIYEKALIGDLRFTPQKRINEDKYFLFKYLLKNNGTVINSNSIVYGYYIRNGSASNSKFSDATLDMLYFSELIEQDVAKLCPDLSDHARYNNVVAHLAVLKKIIRSNDYKKQKKLFNTVKKETVELKKTLKNNIPNNHKLELAMLQLGSVPYLLCVKLFTLLKAVRK